MKFFLQPGESLENNTIFNVIVLGEDEALVLKAIAPYKDEDGEEIEDSLEVEMEEDATSSPEPQPLDQP